MYYNEMLILKKLAHYPLTIDRKFTMHIKAEKQPLNQNWGQVNELTKEKKLTHEKC